MWTDRSRWHRIAVVASVAWFGGVWIAQATSRNDYFAWFTSLYAGRSDPGPATVVATVGIIVIVAICLGIPWIMNTGKRD